MAGLLRDRYFEYATNQAWDLVTGRVVPADTHDDLDGAGRIPRSLIEVLEHGVDGSPRWIVSDTGAKDWHRAAQTIASEARRHGYVPAAGWRVPSRGTSNVPASEYVATGIVTSSAVNVAPGGAE